MQDDRSNYTRRWLQRLSFSFFVIAFFVGWDAYKRHIATGGWVDDWRMLLEAVAAVLSVALGFMGLRERHRPQ
jgi:hypothetical protein